MNRKKFLLSSIIFTAIIMRASFTGIGTILPIIMSKLSLSQNLAGFLSTLPLILFFLFPFIAKSFNHRLGTKETMVFSTAVVCIGIVLRSVGNIAALFLGTFFIGFGINFYNVLLPSIIKKVFPSAVGKVTGIYTSVITISSGLCFYMTPKLALHMGSSWRGALVFWIIFALAAFISWSVAKDYDIEGTVGSNIHVLKQPMLYYVALFFGLQAFLFFSFVTWYPTILLERGISLEQTGVFGLIFQFVGIPVNFIVPVIAEKARNQKIYGMISGTIFTVGMILFYFAHTFVTAMVAFMILGIGSCATLALSFTFIGLRSSNSVVATQVSAITQVLGNGLAALGPVAISGVYYLTSNWNSSIIFLIVVSIVFTIFATLAGSNVEIQ